MRSPTVVEVVIAAAEVRHEAVYCKKPCVHATEKLWDLKRRMDVALSLPVPAIQAFGADSSEEANVVPAVEKYAQMTVLVHNLHPQGSEVVQAVVEEEEAAGGIAAPAVEGDFEAETKNLRSLAAVDVVATVAAAVRSE